jgi:hypothetical protein
MVTALPIHLIVAPYIRPFCWMHGGQLVIQGDITANSDSEWTNNVSDGSQKQQNTMSIIQM